MTSQEYGMRLLRAALVRLGPQNGSYSVEAVAIGIKLEDQIENMLRDLFPEVEPVRYPLSASLSVVWSATRGELALLERVQPLGSLLLVAPLQSLTQRVQLPHTLYLGNDPEGRFDLAVGVWTRGRAVGDGSVRLVRLPVFAAGSVAGGEP